jgi:hypothetical protein
MNATGSPGIEASKMLFLLCAISRHKLAQIRQTHHARNHTRKYPLRCSPPKRSRSLRPRRCRARASQRRRPGRLRVVRETPCAVGGAGDYFSGDMIRLCCVAGVLDGCVLDSFARGGCGTAGLGLRGVCF